MKKHICIVLLNVIFMTVYIHGQELPMLSHTHVNSFLYNPSLAGADFDSKGTVYIVQRNCFSGLAGNPTLSMISGNMPVKDFLIGIGGNVFYEKINVMQTIYGSLAFSYHLPVDNHKRLSLGLSADVYYMGLDRNELKVYNESLIDPVINDYEDGKTRLDFSVGANYQSEYFAIGVTVNSLRATLLQREKTEYSRYHSAYMKFSIPVFYNRDMLEPVITYRSIPYSTSQGSFGIYYSYKKQNSLGSLLDGYFIAGASISTNLSAGMTVGIRLFKRVKLYYNFESSGKYHKYLGCSNEIMVRFDHINMRYLEQGREYQTWDRRKHLFYRWFKRK